MNCVTKHIRHKSEHINGDNFLLNSTAYRSSSGLQTHTTVEFPSWRKENRSNESSDPERLKWIAINHQALVLRVSNTMDQPSKQDRNSNNGWQRKETRSVSNWQVERHRRVAVAMRSLKGDTFNLRENYVVQNCCKLLADYSDQKKKKRNHKIWRAWRFSPSRIFLIGKMKSGQDKQANRESTTHERMQEGKKEGQGRRRQHEGARRRHERLGWATKGCRVGRDQRKNTMEQTGP